MRLAGHLKMTLGELRERMDSAEYSLWLERYFDHPFGDEAWLFATIAANVLNAMPFKKDDAKIWQPQDFLPKRPISDAEAQSIAQMKALAQGLADIIGGKKAKPN